MRQQFEVGDIDVLKSGGPRMTIAQFLEAAAPGVRIERKVTFRELFEFVLLRKYQPGLGLLLI